MKGVRKVLRHVAKAGFFTLGCVLTLFGTGFVYPWLLHLAAIPLLGAMICFFFAFWL